MTTTASSPMSKTVSIAEAARLSGRSDKTIRRWIKAGRLRATRTESGYLVNVEDLSTLSRTVSSPASTPELDSVLDTEREDVQPAASPGKDIMRAEAMAAYTRSILEPLVARMAEQDGVIRTQAETIGRQAAELDVTRERIAALEASHSPVASNLTAESPEPTPEPAPAPDPFPAPLPPTPNTQPWWRRWLGAVYG